MPDKQVIYHKTQKGTEAIANRHSGLAPRLRSLLIMVDGKRTYAELTTMAAALGDPERLSELEAEGLVELAVAEEKTMPAALEPAGAPQQPAAAAASPQRAANLAQAQRFSSHLLEHLLGPMAEPLCIKIEGARDLADFVAAIKRAREIVREIKGSAEAERFVAQIEAQMPVG
ncbi:MAG: hypothetical protein Q8M93_01325 [Polaromonas sp.]|uniref:hypothetical protein n=1 Tax=Polaromonas sp. TaxID=1869339 RepID=UPI00248A8199|nr:hypothetical protein [Polaromonas sp.]MDI1271868.1 hypothetical protein [Polaromonas sp.]MDP2450862.1 hypothetical protein [Polaromonas sp.]MDP3245589.1 hypothetical protein [Polaromonas sp.]MDP3754586.1 hypothetical protein [Polaromonas sp.]